MPRRFSPQNLQRLREAAGLSRQDLADKTRRTFWSVYGWERGYNAPTANLLGAIADTLGCSIDDLFTEEERP